MVGYMQRNKKSHNGKKCMKKQDKAIAAGNEETRENQKWQETCEKETRQNQKPQKPHKEEEAKEWEMEQLEPC